jgi:hypothetical protein
MPTHPLYSPGWKRGSKLTGAASGSAAASNEVEEPGACRRHHDCHSVTAIKQIPPQCSLSI